MGKKSNEVVYSPIGVFLAEALRKSSASVNRLANDLEKEAKIDRRTLGFLEEHKNVELHVEQLLALNRWLAKYNCHFLRTPALSDALLASETVTFLLAAYPNRAKKRRLCSPWDVQAMNHFRDTIERRGFGGRIELGRIDPESADEKLLGEPAPRASIICVGSPRALRLCDTMIKRMHSYGKKNMKCDVRFYWRDGGATGESVLSPETPLRSKLGDCSAAVAIDDRLWSETSNLINPAAKKFATYAVVMARWMAPGCIWACIAGLTGPATEAAAHAGNLEFSVQSPDDSTEPTKRASGLGATSSSADRPKSLLGDSASPVAYYVIEATVLVDPNVDVEDDPRRLDLSKTRVVFGPHYLTPTPQRLVS